MKKLVCVLLAIGLTSALWYGCKDKEELPGEIHGVVTDKATGEPIKTAGVELQPVGLKTVTGTDGQYGFSELEPGKYKLYITKTGYAEWLSNEIVVKSDQTSHGDVQLEKLPPALRIVNDKSEDIDSLDFGAAEDDVLRSFNVFNDGTQTLQWQITKAADWISEVSKESGELGAGKTQVIIVTIDRERLKGGDNVTTLHVTSDDGSKQLKIKAMGEKRSLPTLNTQEVTDVKMTSAVFHGVLTDVGVPYYTERGFVYGLSSMPTIENTIGKLTVAVTEEKSFQATVTNLEDGKTYYVRAYAVNKAGVAYSTNEVRCEPKTSLAVVRTDSITNKNIGAGRATLNGSVEEEGDPAYTEKGFVYGIVPNPTVDDTKKVVSGSGIGKYSANISGLEEGKEYHVRAYATNANGTAYGEDKSVDMTATMPKVSTREVSNIRIAQEMATFTGFVDSLGDLGYTERGFVYAETHNPTVDDAKLVVSGNGIGVYSANASDIKEGKIYYIRAYLTNDKGSVYGNEVELDFNAVKAIVKTEMVTDLTDSRATFNATIEEIGDPTYAEFGFVYGTQPTPMLEDGISMKVSIEGNIGEGRYMRKVEDLTGDETYYVRAYARNEYYTSYGDVVSFVPQNQDYVVLKESGLMVQRADIGSGTWSTADMMCKGSTCSGYTDWRLPTKEELMILFNNREKVESFSENDYWSSSYASPFKCYCVDMLDGSISAVQMDEVKNIRAVRSVNGQNEAKDDVAKELSAFLQMVYVEGGTFTMGATEEQDSYSADEKPVHSVTLDGFYIGKFEVTQAQWKAVMGTNPSYFKGDDFPVESVSWNDAVQFCEKLSQMTGKTYRLPTEAEWEYAARGGQQADGTKYAGSNTIDDVAWYVGNSGNETHPVGTRQPNALGLYDMSGNAWEWCSDWYGTYSSLSAVNPQGPSSGSRRVIRGGDWNSYATYCRVSYRYNNSPGYGYIYLGFRVVCEP